MKGTRGTEKIVSVVLIFLFLFSCPAREAGAQTSEEQALAQLQELFQQIKANYAGPVEDRALWEGALKGMVEALGDPHSTYLNREELAAITADLLGTFGGIGAVVTDVQGTVVVVAPLQGTPAARAGLLAGDQIIAVDGVDVRGLSADRVTDMLRGQPGSRVELTLRRGGEEFKVHLTRELIEVNPVAGQILPDGIGYIKLASFSEHTERRLLETLRRLEGQGLKAVILDLRNNPGGFFSQALAVLRQFAPRGPILEMVEGNGRRQVFYSYQDRNRWPLVILINGGSASGAEIVAASLKDLGAATLVGTPSFGKGTIQTVLPLQGGAAVKLTTARYFTPRGNPITGAGLQPDVLVHQPTDGVGPLRLQRVLSRGTGGLDVARLQEALGALGYFGGRVDGIFGAETEAAVRAFQAGVGLPETGVVDGETAAALDRVLTGGSGGRDLQLERALQLLREGMGKVGGDTADRK